MTSQQDGHGERGEGDSVAQEAGAGSGEYQQQQMRRPGSKPVREGVTHQYPLLAFIKHPPGQISELDVLPVLCFQVLPRRAGR